MLASIPIDDMTKMLRVLAGENAANAARHFTRHSYNLGDVGSVALWSRIAQALTGASPAAASGPAPALAPEKATPSRLVRESIASHGVRYEDVDAATLALEEPPAIVVASPHDWAGERFGFVRAARAIVRKVSKPNSADAPDFGLAQAA